MRRGESNSRRAAYEAAELPLFYRANPAMDKMPRFCDLSSGLIAAAATLFLSLLFLLLVELGLHKRVGEVVHGSAAHTGSTNQKSGRQLCSRELR